MIMLLILICNLCVDYIIDVGDVCVCNNVSFDLVFGEVFGFVGEFGCGKFIVVFLLMCLYKLFVFIIGGEVIFNGEDILKYSDECM